MAGNKLANLAECQLVWPFPKSRKIGSTVYVGLQSMMVPNATGSMSIHDQTHHAFGALVGELERHGASMKNLSKMHTYYVYDGDGRDVTDYWESMTSVRLQYLADPGPAATALRTRGVWPGKGTLIGVDGIAELDADKARIMPAHTWDWSIPTPFSQGWRVGSKVYVGGQISADMAGRAVAPSEVGKQTINTMDFIESILKDAGAGWNQVDTLKIAYRHTGDEAEARQTLDLILKEVRRYFPETHKPVLVAFGVDLLYEGLVLEFDATAILNMDGTPLLPAGCGTWADSVAGFPPGIRAGEEIYLGGLSAPGAASLEAQAEATLGRVGQVLAQGDADYQDLVKLNVYVATGEDAEIAKVVGILENFLAPGKTVVSILKVTGLPWPGQRIQIDGLALLNQQS